MSGDVIDMGPSSGDTEEIYKQLVADLEHQIELCKNNAQTFQKLGDLPSAKHYAQQFQNQNKDLANLKGIRVYLLLATAPGRVYFLQEFALSLTAFCKYSI